MKPLSASAKSAEFRKCSYRDWLDADKSCWAITEDREGVKQSLLAWYSIFHRRSHWAVQWIQRVSSASQRRRNHISHLVLIDTYLDNKNIYLTKYLRSRYNSSNFINI